jgi:hypothetical protein
MRETTYGMLSGSARMHAPFSQPGTSRRSQQEAVSDLPSIEDFLDELPSIDDYVWAAADVDADHMPSIDEYLEDYSADSDENVVQPRAATDFDNDGWAIADWQSFDWSGAAMLGSRTEEQAAGATGAENEGVVGMPGDSSPSRRITPSADEVARALDGIAQRIRSGELLIDQLTGAPPEAAMAAALAALLRMRD